MIYFAGGGIILRVRLAHGTIQVVQLQSFFATPRSLWEEDHPSAIQQMHMRSHIPTHSITEPNLFIVVESTKPTSEVTGSFAHFFLNINSTSLAAKAKDPYK
jgi:hypothetical protein